MSQNLGPSLERGIWAAVAIAAVIVILRVVGKIKINRFRIDDGLMIFAEILAIVSSAFLTLSVPIVTISTTIARSAFIIYIIPLVGTYKYYQAALWVVLAIQFAGNVASAVLPLSICRNVAALWDPAVAAATTCGNLNAVMKFAYYSNTFNSATDLFLAVFPTVVFWNLNLKLPIKLGLIALLSLGIVAMIASIIKTTKLDSVPSITNTGAAGGIELIRWGYIENVIIIITSSVPCIRPLIMSSVRKLSSGKYSHTYELGMPFSGRKTTGAPNETNQSRRTRRFKSDVENNSIDRILGHEHSARTGTSIEGAPDSPTSSGPGITKQVEISVFSDVRPPMQKDRSFGS
ncbi:hypothetical protein DTO013E5_7528 [Penicillium roqueforti]|uniref:Rhodopsin domain-containing protein n=1 Tax=Penicillium roqueforti (strain FM164) TaxID=1365484 RepID=W6QTB2_PENRF|nr:hypothetical protein DTO012A1_3294 [Penicillium roqueforti]CDM37359.1 unnamed protein product [Penicillium roqueforti FM164]KAI2749193.1 hypothetical protein DTO013F2_5737 [Penicillium roqueforti]KAI2770147.1 hypothetical protein DTO012A8_4916 [Penicillium roqueforti]KAI3070524.1 hypothetical protein CBS147339_7486 [Penicillium roqueforti]